ncbi:MAG TPA: hypothetical protein VK957_04245 [Lunatimonas sp.]|nr:hypothetical protein [Lunatimonas sp.]
MKNKLLPQVYFFVISLGLFSCFGSENNELESYLPLEDCVGISYGDTIFYVREGVDHKVLPQKMLEGTFRSLPEGLSIDPNTGEIDINASEAGLKYKIILENEAMQTACSYTLTIGGINYIDSRFVLDQGETQVTPTYNSSISVTPCDMEDHQEECHFDVKGPDGNQISDLGIAINKRNGAIDLQQTVDNEFFGQNPTNGQEVEVEMYYRLSDESAGALNSIGLRFFYFETMGDVPHELLEEIEERQTQLFGDEDFATNPFFRVAPSRSRQAPPSGRARPPYLVVVSRLR